MASFLVDKAVNATCSSSRMPFTEGQRLLSGVTEGDCCCSVSGRGFRQDRGAGRMVAVVCGLQLHSRGHFSPSSSSSWPSEEFSLDFSRSSVSQGLGQSSASSGRRRGRPGNRVVTLAIPIDAYWITAAEAIAVAVLMAGVAVVAGILINIRIEVQALAEYKELEAKGLLPDIPDGEFDRDAPLYIFQNKKLLASNPPSRNRPVREEFDPQLDTQTETETKKELETATKE